ncbi:hypothetical protein Sgleb_11720 [Streptomyces glebosus]|uniref:Uncharacterized protein n=1 Tax=Streptomyces glebosus TaxID=249580 RepID=A0A640SUC6_9ACTN|nr:hypothetical protein Sgleb_11720 [Streptomyces glebosus]GHG78357.1 hypothetical protein GCM10010513_54670 [Streptomyces glebosus]
MSPSWGHLPAVAGGQLVRDFGKSRAKALKDIKARLPMRQRAGMPKYKKKREALPTLEYTKRGFRLKDGRLHLAGGTVVRVVWSRDLPEPPSSVRVYRDSTGAWYASFVVPTVPKDLPAIGRVIGIDWGVRETATTTSDDHDLPHPQYGKNAAERLTKYQRMMADAAIGATKAALAEMARKHGRAVHLVHPRTPRWAVRGAEREPSTHYLFPREPMPAPRAEPYPPGIRTPPA